MKFVEQKVFGNNLSPIHKEGAVLLICLWSGLLSDLATLKRLNYN